MQVSFYSLLYKSESESHGRTVGVESNDKKNELKTRRWIKTRIMDELSGILYELNKKLDKI